MLRKSTSPLRAMPSRSRPENPPHAYLMKRLAAALILAAALLTPSSAQAATRCTLTSSTLPTRGAVHGQVRSLACSSGTRSWREPYALRAWFNYRPDAQRKCSGILPHLDHFRGHLPHLRAGDDEGPSLPGGPLLRHREHRGVGRADLPGSLRLVAVGPRGYGPLAGLHEDVQRQPRIDGLDSTPFAG